MATHVNDLENKEASEMQQANATGANQNEQGRAAFTTGSTTGGGSNFGQGSHQLGGGSYRQGSTSNAGANYDNEVGRLGNNRIATSNEGKFSERAGASRSGMTEDQDKIVSGKENDTTSSHDGSHNQHWTDDGPGDSDYNATSLKQTSNLGSDNAVLGDRNQTRSWSDSSESSL